MHTPHWCCQSQNLVNTICVSHQIRSHSTRPFLRFTFDDDSSNETPNANNNNRKRLTTTDTDDANASQRKTNINVKLQNVFVYVCSCVQCVSGCWSQFNVQRRDVAMQPAHTNRARMEKPFNHKCRIDIWPSAVAVAANVQWLRAYSSSRSHSSTHHQQMCVIGYEIMSMRKRILVMAGLL